MGGQKRREVKEIKTEGEVIWLDALIDGSGGKNGGMSKGGDCRSECKVGIN